MSDLSAAWTRARGALSQRFQQQGQALRWTRVREALMLRSLSARSFTATVCGLVLIQLVSFGLVHYAEERQTRTRMLAFMSADISLVYEVMDRTPQQERPRWIGWLNRGFYQISLGKADGIRSRCRRGSCRRWTSSRSGCRSSCGARISAGSGAATLRS